MPDMTQETQIALIERDVIVLKSALEEVREELMTLQVERDKALKWGIATLGALLLSVVAFVVNFVKDHVK